MGPLPHVMTLGDETACNAALLALLVQPPLLVQT